MGNPIASKGYKNVGSYTTKGKNNYIFCTWGKIPKTSKGEFIIPIIKHIFRPGFLKCLRKLFASCKTEKDFMTALSEVDESVIRVKVRIDPPKIWINGLPQEILSSRSTSTTDDKRDIESLRRNVTFLKYFIERHGQQIPHRQWIPKVFPEIDPKTIKENPLADDAIESDVRRLCDEKTNLFERALKDRNKAEQILEKTSTYVRLNTSLSS